MIYSVVVSCPDDAEQESEVCFAAIDSANRFFQIVERDTAVIPFHWKSTAVISTPGRPQDAINAGPIAQADALVAFFRSRFGSPTGVTDSGTKEEIEEALSRRIPCLVCFYTGMLGTFDPDELVRIRRYKKRVEKQVLTFSYTSPAQLQCYLTEWLFKLFDSKSRIPSNTRQDELQERLTIAEYLSGPVASPVSGVLYTLADTKAEALLTLRKPQTLTEYADIHGWKVKVEDDKNMAKMHDDFIFERPLEAKWNEILLNHRNRNNETYVTGYVLFDMERRIVYLNSPLQSRLDEVFEGIHHQEERAHGT